jgi:hypothetical protein
VASALTSAVLEMLSIYFGDRLGLYRAQNGPSNWRSLSDSVRVAGAGDQVSVAG